MAKIMRCRQPKRGPKRKPASSLKIACGYKNCRARCDCKNKMTYSLDVSDAKPSALRKMRGHCSTIKFCSEDHRAKCICKPSIKRGGREALTAEQVVHLFNIFVNKVQCAWAGVCFLIGVLLGERCELICSLKDSWFKGLNPSDGFMPQLAIEEINKKTKQREVPVDKELGALLWKWATQEPLKSNHGRGTDQWPHRGQKLFRRLRSTSKQTPCSEYLFPGRSRGGLNERNWRKPVTARGLFSKFQLAQKVLKDEMALARRNRLTSSTT